MSYRYMISVRNQKILNQELNSLSTIEKAKEEAT